MKEYGATEAEFAQAEEYAGLKLARVVSQAKNMYRAVCEYGEVNAEISGKLRYNAGQTSDYPAVGDFVMLDYTENQAGSAVIRALLPRRSVFSRKAAGTAVREQIVAANIDTVFICMSLNNDYNIRRLERYLSVCYDSGAVPVIVLTKADLCGADELADKRNQAEELAFGTDVLVISSLAEDGYSAVLPYIKPQKTIALIGSSGVGKSTLINRLLGTELLKTGGLRDDDRGHHTTTGRELLRTEAGALIIDTPGMRELGMWESEEGVARAFADIEELACSCRFSDCTHSGEPGCAVRRAIAAGELDEARFISYQKLKKENAYNENAADYLVKKEEWFKSIAKRNKSNKKK